MDGARDTFEDFEALPTLETVRPAYLHVAERTITKEAPRRSPGYQAKRERLLEEARIAALLEHPSFAALLHVIEDPGGTRAIFDRADGVDLAGASSILRGRNEAFPFEVCVFIVLEVLEAAGYAHRLHDEDGTPLELVLRDLVPANVIVSKTGRIELATHALSLIPSGDDVRPHPGAAAYLAPERIARAGHDARADIYAIGLLLFELLLGRPCFGDLETREVLKKVVHDGIPIAALHRERVPEELAEIARAATARRPADRYESAEAMADALFSWQRAAGDDMTTSVLAKFFLRQRLFEGTEPTVVRLRDLLDEDATVRATLDQEPPNETLSAVIIREELDPSGFPPA